MQYYHLTIHIADALPNTPQILLPQCNFAIPTADSQEIPGKAPGDTPDNVREFPCRSRGRSRRRCQSGGRVESRLNPRRGRSIFRPDEHSFVLGSSSDITPRQPDIRRPRNVPYPISVSLQRLFLNPRLRVLSVPPNLDKVVTACTGKALDCLMLRWLCGLAGNGLGMLGSNKRAGLGGRSPRNGVAADGVTIEDIGAPLTVVCSARY